jgi:hypothetical protein
MNKPPVSLKAADDRSCFRVLVLSTLRTVRSSLMAILHQNDAKERSLQFLLGSCGCGGLDLDRGEQLRKIDDCRLTIEKPTSSCSIVNQ